MRIILTFFLFFLLKGVAFPQSQDSTEIQNQVNTAVEFQKSFNPKKSLRLLNDLLPKAKKLYPIQSKDLAKIYYHIASAKLDLSQYDEAKNLLDQALSIFKLYDTVSVELGDTYLLFGIYYDYMADYDKALAYYELTKGIYSKLYPLNDLRFGYLYNNIAICIYFKGDIERALNFFNKALTITFENSGKNDTKVSRDISNMSNCHSKLNKLSLAKQKLNYSLANAKHNKVQNTFVGARIHHALATTNLELEDHTNALLSIDLALKIRKEHFPEFHIEIGSSYFVMASIYQSIGDLELAKTYLTKALSNYTNIFGKTHRDIAQVHSKLSKILLRQNKPEEALVHINEALSIFEYDENLLLQDQNKFDIEVLEALDMKAQIHFMLWQQTDNLAHLKTTDHVYTDLIAILNDFRKGFKEELSKEILAGDFFHVFEGAIESSYALYEETQNNHYLNTAFERSEYSTSFVLLEGRRNTTAKSISEIPDSLLKKEKKLKLDVTFFEKKKRSEELKEEPDQNKINQLASQIFDLKEQYYVFVQNLENDFPEYYRYKYDLRTVSVEKLQNQTLQEDQTLVEYFVGEKNIFIFIVSKNLFKVKKIEKKFPLETWVDELRKKITEFQFPFNLDSDYHQKLLFYSTSLYWDLIAPIENDFTERITIIPGGILAEIPFECLIKQAGTTEVKYKEHEYLLYDYAISYCYSATLLDEMVSNKKKKSNPKTIAFAPNFSDFGKSSNLRDFTLMPLQFNKTEVEEIAKSMGAKVVLGHNATEDYFIDQSHQYSILHFATHAKADNFNGDYGFLAFSEVFDTLENELLFVKDIYNLSLQSEMVTLSACETGIGESRKGEGIISLSRGFSFAGTSNINTSLWNVSDIKAAQLMKSFYSYIADGDTKDEAMRHAKKDLISSYSNNMQVHPFFWTAMISIGDMRPIDLPWKPNPIIWIAVLIIIGFLFRKWWIRNDQPH